MTPTSPFDVYGMDASVRDVYVMCKGGVRIWRGVRV